MCSFLRPAPRICPSSTRWGPSVGRIWSHTTQYGFVSEPGNPINVACLLVSIFDNDERGCPKNIHNPIFQAREKTGLFHVPRIPNSTPCLVDQVCPTLTLRLPKKLTAASTRQESGRRCFGVLPCYHGRAVRWIQSKEVKPNPTNVVSQQQQPPGILVDLKPIGENNNRSGAIWATPKLAAGTKMVVPLALPFGPKIGVRVSVLVESVPFLAA